LSPVLAIERQFSTLSEALEMLFKHRGEPETFSSGDYKCYELLGKGYYGFGVRCYKISTERPLVVKANRNCTSKVQSNEINILKA